MASLKRGDQLEKAILILEWFAVHRCWYSSLEIAEEFGWCKRTAHRWLGVFEGFGLIESEVRGVNTKIWWRTVPNRLRIKL
jgi:DNA-binding IclR family transcriptional regulator